MGSDMKVMHSGIIPVYNNEDRHVVDARELHGFLEVGRDFSSWIKDRIDKYGFTLNEDYEVVELLSSPDLGNAKARPQVRKDYLLTMDVAKELCMVENNDKGREARKYFIECEKKLRDAVVTPEKLGEALLDPDVMIKILTDLKEERAKRLEAERTKALIGSKREATAMATASTAKRELEKVKDKLGEGKAWKQVKAISWIGEMFDKDSKPYSSIGKHLKKLSEKMGYDVRSVEDSQYGSVNVYHVNVIEAMKKELESDDLLLYRFREKKMRKKERGVVHE